MSMTYPSNKLKRIVARANLGVPVSYPAPNVAIAWVKGREIILHGPAMGKYRAHNRKELSRVKNI